MKVFTAPSIKSINKREKRWQAMSLFSGCGGASVGYKMAGFNIMYANEFIPIAAETYKANAPDTVVDSRDIRTVTAAQLLKRFGLKKGGLDLLESSPPCSAFSLVGTRDKQWGEEKLYSENVKQRVDDLFDEHLRLVRGLMPKVVVAENVPGLAFGKAQGVLLSIIEQMQKIGYEVDARIVDPMHLGLPQTRKRLIITSIRKDIYKKLGLTSIPYPVPQKGQIAVRDVLPHIERIRIARDAATTRFEPADRPSPTIVASDGTNSMTGRFSCGAFVDTVDGERRKYTVEEMKVLFGFPKDFVLLGKYEQQVERLGRSHSPCSTYHIGKVLGEQVFSKL